MALVPKGAGGMKGIGYENQAIADAGYRNKVPMEGALVPTVPGQHNQHESTLPGADITMLDKEALWFVNREESRQENLQECRGMCMFFVFLIFFTLSMVFDSATSSARLADHVRQKLEDGALRLDDIKSVPETYDYLRRVIIPSLYENNTDIDRALELSAYYHPIDMANRMIGGVRLRQVRVDYTENCQVGPLFEQYSIKCFPGVSAATESKIPFGADKQFTHAADSHGTSYVGSLATYAPDGFIKVLPTDREQAQALVDQLEAENFLGAWTRGFFIDVVVWNANFGAYAIATVNLEFGASGDIASHVAMLTMSARAMKPGGLGSSEDQQAVAFLVIVFLFLGFFIYEEIREARKNCKAYFMDGWNVLDWVNMLLLLTAFGIRAFVWVELSSLAIGEKQLVDKDEFSSLRGVAVFVEMVKLVNSMNAVILYGKVVKYLRHTPVTRDLINTFWKALELLVPFLCMAMIALLSFSIAYNIGFGNKIVELSTLGSSIMFLTRAFLKDVRFMPAYSFIPLFGAILILIFYIVFMVLGVNVLFAIIVDAILRDKWENKGKKKNDKFDLHEGEPVEEFVREAKKKIRRFLKKRSPRVYKMLYRRKRKVVVQAKVEDKAGEEVAEFVVAESDSDSDNPFDDDTPKLPDKEDLMRSIEHMAGRVLSEVSVVSIEIKSELHDVCERVAQMQMAVEELSLRTDGVRLDQEEFLAINSGG